MGKIVVVGSINADMVFTSDVRPNAGETVLGNNFSVIPGGKGANQAVAASKLGAEVYMVGCVGNDMNGELSINNMIKSNIITDSVDRITDTPTGVAGIIVAEDDNSIIVISGANNKLTRDIIDKHKQVILNADMVLLQLEIPIDAVEYVLDICKKNNIKTMLNPAPAVELTNDMIENATYLTPNEHEVKIIFGNSNLKNIDEMLKKYPNKLIVTMGSKGVKYFDGSDIVTVPVYKVKVLDTTGAGDTFNGALATALVRGEELSESIKFANKAAGISTTKLGAQSGMPTVEQLNNIAL